MKFTVEHNGKELVFEGESNGDFFKDVCGEFTNGIVYTKIIFDKYDSSINIRDFQKKLDIDDRCTVTTDDGKTYHGIYKTWSKIDANPIILLDCNNYTKGYVVTRKRERDTGPSYLVRLPDKFSNDITDAKIYKDYIRCKNAMIKVDTYALNPHWYDVYEIKIKENEK